MKETKLISELEYLNFINKFRNIIIEIIIGMALGVLFNVFVLHGYFEMGVFFAVVFAGIPYAWSCMSVYFTGIIGIVINFIIAMVLGWVITPIALIYNFIQMKRYEKHVKDAVDKGNVA